MLARNGEDVERREVRRLTARFGIEIGADASDEFRVVVFRGEHARQADEIPGLHRLHVGGERPGRRRPVPSAAAF